MEQPRNLEELKEFYRQNPEEYGEQLRTVQILENLGRAAQEIYRIMMENDEAALALLYNEQQGRMKPESKKIAEKMAAQNLLGQLNVVKGDVGKETALVLLTQLDGYMYSIHEQLYKPENNLDLIKLSNIRDWLQSKLEKPKLDSTDLLMLERLSGLLEIEIYPKYGAPNTKLKADEVLKEIQARLNVFEAERNVAKRAAAEANAKKAALIPLFAELTKQKEALATAQRALAAETNRRGRVGGVVKPAFQDAVTSATAAVAAAEKAIRNAGGNLGAPVVANVVPSMVPVVAANAPRASAGEAGAAASQSQPLTPEQRAAAILARITAAQAGRTSGSGGKRTMKKKSKKTKKVKKTHKSRRHQRK